AGRPRCAGAALAAQLERHLVDGELRLAGPRREAFDGARLVELRHGPAVIANGEHDSALVARMPAGDEGIERLEPVRLSIGDETVERAIDRLRRQARLVAQLLDELVGADRPPDAAQRLDDHLVLLGSGSAFGALANHRGTAFCGSSTI